MESPTHSAALCLIRDTLSKARGEAAAAVRQEMLEAYWRIGKRLAESEGLGVEGETGCLARFSGRMRERFGSVFTPALLAEMRRFFLAFPDHGCLRGGLSWTHFRLLLRVEEQKAREFFLTKCLRRGWSARELARQIERACGAKPVCRGDAEEDAA